MYKALLRDRRAKKSHADHEIPYAEDEQGYGLCLALLGNGRIKVFCNDGQERLAKICGRMRKFNRQLIEKGNLLLVSFRSFQDDKADCIHKYTDDDARYLERIGELSDALIKKRQQGEGLVGLDTVEVHDVLEFSESDFNSL